MPWASFLEGLSLGDTGTTWTPTFQGLTEDGTATIMGKYWRLSNSICYFKIVITPAISTSSTLGTTFCNNFPMVIVSDSASNSCSSYTASTAGITALDNRIYTATWAAVTSTVTITGTIEVR